MGEIVKEWLKTWIKYYKKINKNKIKNYKNICTVPFRIAERLLNFNEDQIKTSKL